MGNELNGRTWLLDSTGTITQKRVAIERIDWIGPSTAAHDLVIKETGGDKDVIVQCVADVSKSNESWDLKDRIYNGVTLDTLDSGKVLMVIAEVL